MSVLQATLVAHLKPQVSICTRKLLAMIFGERQDRDPWPCQRSSEKLVSRFFGTAHWERQAGAQEDMRQTKSTSNVSGGPDDRCEDARSFLSLGDVRTPHRIIEQRAIKRYALVLNREPYAATYRPSPLVDIRVQAG